MNSTLLAIYAHPDDETMCSGTMAQMAERGWRVVLICATGGEAGEISDPILATPDNLGEVRTRELRCACDKLGVRDLIMLGYCDSGMAETSVNEQPTSFIQSEAQIVIDRLVTIMTELRPTITITFEPNGVYGHPDHIAISRFATEAFDRYADRVEDAGRLFYNGLPHSFFLQMQELAAAHNVSTQEVQEIITAFADFQEIVTHEIDVSDKRAIIREALKCHRTQLGNGGMFDLVLQPESQGLQDYEYFAQVWPALIPGSLVATSFLA